jgi:hypothetical protein
MARKFLWGLGSGFYSIINMHLYVQPVDNVSTAARLAEVRFSQFSIDCWCLGFLSQSAERPMRPEPPLVAQWACRHHIGAPTVVERGTIARSATPCMFPERASSPALRVDNVCGALALSVAVAHV